MSNKTTHFGFQDIPIHEKVSRVTGVFDSVAGKYDLMNDLMSLGSHRLLKKITVEMTALRKGQRVLDVAGGTGDIAARLSSIVGSDGQVVMCDINESMLNLGRDKLLNLGFVGNLSYVQADAETLPFPENSFDCVTIGFGLRNMTDKQKALESMLRTLKPGARLVVLEFSQPVNPLLKNAYDGFTSLWPKIGKLVTGDEESYRYLVESIHVHPPQEELVEMMEAAGFKSCNYHNLLGGIAAVHTGFKP